MSATTTIYVEESGTPIYTRIAQALGRELTRLGHSVLIVKPKAFNHESYLSFIQGAPPDAVYVSNAGSNVIQSRLPGQPTHYFEHFKGRTIFLHQDNILSSQSFEQGLARLQAWQRVASRSAHLCIEPSNVQTLKQAGIEHAAVVPHASEIEATAPLIENFEHRASFVGHVVPSVYRQSSTSASVDALLHQLFAQRQADMSAPVQEAIQHFSNQALDCLGNSPENTAFRLAHALWVRGQLMHQSLQYRGWVFEQAQIDGLEIFGGDPAYLHGVERSLRIEREHIAYQPAIYEMDALSRIFRRSTVNINVSSLQFDHAVVNRFHDVVMAGGLCLTDRRDGLAELTRHHAEVSFSTVAELEDKVRYYSRADKARERANLISAMQAEVVERSGYPLLAREIVQSIATLSA